MRCVSKLAGFFLVCLFVARPDRPAEPPAVSPLLLDDPAVMVSLEASGFSFAETVGPARLATLTATVERDMADRTHGIPADRLRHPFLLRWLTLGHFELIGVVNRIDRAPFDAPGAGLCGEVRLVYRLALTPPGRPTTRLPMTVNVRIPQPARAGDADCRAVARRWGTDSDVASILRALPPFTKLEVNFQSVHVPTSLADMDDNAEYVLRTFDVAGDHLTPDPLFNTPRVDLTDRERAELAAWVLENVDAIDRGTASVPAKFLATRAVSLSPRGLVHVQNRPFSQLFPDARATFGGASLGARALVRTPELLVRRLDEATCPGCHQTHSVAGFHLLGEERDPKAVFNALANGRSPHLTTDLRWRADALASVARGEPFPSRPFAAHPTGAYGDPCGLVDGFAAWTCGPGLSCRNVHHADVGVCSPSGEGEAGDPCEDVRTRASSRPQGAQITPLPKEVQHPRCRAATNDPKSPFCAPNSLGFTGGMCSQLCPTVGVVRDGAICAQVPLSGYENDCLFSYEPIEQCLARYYAATMIATCSAERPCRDDYECVRVPGAPAGTGACAPPYFVFQIRVDGPLLDR